MNDSPASSTSGPDENASSVFRFEASEGGDSPAGHHHLEDVGLAADATRDIADVTAVEIISSACVHLMSAAAVKIGLAEDEETGNYQDLAEARALITSLAGLVTAASPEIGNEHARSLRDGLRTLQLAFAEALPFPDEPGRAPGEKWTGRVS
ncbi:DUF1844 domain-containing protein [Brachybacterium endophyticum]|uniref:DUF1844 domain-containing protein n=1 Tax=Brachybacterium endophyticum TaxID=2182385 RepID=A0A2U2RH65_9MICO|nr:DUF1844 domain-containing protein [Brachybacterium endophyticum]PWH05115.1 DUF1844 domain-containing protein [Brachybacterium endophyticum]